MKTLIFKVVARRVLVGALVWCAHHTMHLIPHVGSHLISHVVISFLGSLVGGAHH